MKVSYHDAKKHNFILKEGPCVVCHACQHLRNEFTHNLEFQIAKFMIVHTILFISASNRPSSLVISFNEACLMDFLEVLQVMV